MRSSPGVMVGFMFDSIVWIRISEDVNTPFLPISEREVGYLGGKRRRHVMVPAQLGQYGFLRADLHHSCLVFHLLEDWPRLLAAHRAVVQQGDLHCSALSR